jgi:hypothetical protein
MEGPAAVIRTQIVGSSTFVAAINHLPEEVQKAANEAVIAATKKLRDDVATHTPVKTGRGRSSVVAWFRAGTGTVQYDYRATEAFYMRFVVGGALPHRIVPKYGTARGLRQAIKRRTNAGESTDDIKPKRALKIPMSFASVGGTAMYAAKAHHPGIGARRILTRRLSANEAEILATLRSHIEKSIYLRSLARADAGSGR